MEMMGTSVRQSTDFLERRRSIHASTGMVTPKIAKTEEQKAAEAAAALAVAITNFKADMATLEARKKEAIEKGNRPGLVSEVSSSRLNA